MKFLSPDSGLMRGWNNLTDGVWINILMLVTSIPLVTVGAALTAGHDAARKTLAGEGHVTTNYFRSFKSNFVKSTVQWLIFGVALAVLSYAWVVLQIVPLLIPKFGFTIVWIMGFEWVWALQARFEKSLGGTLANAFIFGVTNVASTIALAIIDVAFLGLIVGSWFYMPQGLFLLVVLGYGSVLMLHVPILEHAFAKYVNKPESDGRGTVWRK